MKYGTVIRLLTVACLAIVQLTGCSSDVEEMEEIGYEDYIYGEGVSLIEWANLIEEILPEHYTEIKIEKDLEKGFDYRRITICEY